MDLRKCGPGILACFLSLIPVGCASRGGQTSSLTPEAKAYVRNLQLSDVSMKATEAYSGQSLTEIEGKVANGGTRIIKSAAVSCVFYDRYGQVIKRERVPMVKTELKPGETRSFRLPFDDLPESWNNQMPQLVIASITFA